MKVCFLTGEYPPMQGGIADHTAHLARHLIPLGVEVSVLTSRKATRHPESPISGLSVYSLIPAWGPGCWRQIPGWLGEHRPDVLHIQYQAAAYDLGGWVNWLPWWLRRGRTASRIVVTFHDLRVPYLFPKAGPLRWRSILALARHADAVVVTNQEDEETLRKALGIRESGIGGSGNSTAALADSLSPNSPIPNFLTLIPLGSNVDPQPPSDYDRDGWRARIGIDGHALLLAYFGFLNESKGGEELVLALERLARQGTDAHLLMIGGQVGDVDPTNRAYAGRVQSLIELHGLAERVHWTGYTSPEEVSANLLAADVVVMPYRDGVSFRRTTFIAALRHGRPVVTTHPATPLPELCDGDNLLLVPPGNVDRLTAAIGRLGDDPALRVRLSAGAQALGRRFEWPEISRRTLDLYRRLAP
jgi:glycosyltransferase involved in cell wall biosynthesis